MPPLTTTRRHPKLADHLVAGELNAQLQLLRLGRMGRPVARSILCRAYGPILNEYLDLTSELLALRGITVSVHDRGKWRDHIASEFFRNAVRLEDRWIAAERKRSWVIWFKSWLPWERRRIIEAYWRHNIQQVGADGRRRSLDRMVEEVVSLWCTIMMAKFETSP